MYNNGNNNNNNNNYEEYKITNTFRLFSSFVCKADNSIMREQNRREKEQNIHKLELISRYKQNNNSNNKNTNHNNISRSFRIFLVKKCKKKLSVCVYVD